MGVYIKGVSGLPGGCGECVFVKQRETSLGTFGDCPFLGTVSRECITKRHDGCPLVELPSKHGRLVDADLAMEKLATDKREAYTKHDVWLKFSIYGAPTVLEAEGDD